MNTVLNRGLKEITSGSIWVVLGLFLGYILEYINRIIIGRLFGTSDYGLISLSLAVAIVCASISLLGFQSGAARYIAIFSEDDQKSKAGLIVTTGLKIIIPVGILLIIILILGKKVLISYLIKESSLFPIVVPFIVMIPIIGVAEFFYSCLRGLKLAKYSIFSKEIIRRLPVLIILCSMLIFIPKKLIIVSYAYLIGFIVYMLVSGLWVRKNVSFDNKNYKHDFKVKEFILFSLPLLFSFMLKRFGSEISNIVVGFFRDTEEVGYLSAALPFARLIIFPLTAVLFMFLPVMSEYWHKKKDRELRIVFMTVCNWLFCASGLVFLLFILYSEPIIVKSFGENFRPAHQALIILSIGQFFNAICGPTGALLLAAGESKKYFIGDFISIFISFILYLIIVPKFGFLGAAYVNMAHLILINVFYLIFVYKISRLFPFNKKILYALFLLLLVILFFKNFTSGISLIFQIVLTIVIYFAIIILTGVLRKDSVVFFYNFLSQGLRKNQHVK